MKYQTKKCFHHLNCEDPCLFFVNSRLWSRYTLNLKGMVSLFHCSQQSKNSDKHLAKLTEKILILFQTNLNQKNSLIEFYLNKTHRNKKKHKNNKLSFSYKLWTLKISVIVNVMKFFPKLEAVVRAWVKENLFLHEVNAYESFI